MSELLEDVYAQRFSDADAAAKNAIWREITAFLQRYVPEDGAVLDIACDRGDFIRNISASEKWATDLRDVSSHLPQEVRFVQANGLELDRHLPHDHFDVAFMSNYLEHLANGEAVMAANGSGSFTKANVATTVAIAQAMINTPSNYYFNVHSTINTGGCARGQLVKQ